MLVIIIIALWQKKVNKPINPKRELFIKTLTYYKIYGIIPLLK